MNIEKERELFEVFYLKEFGDDYTCPYAQLDKRGGEYIDFHAQDTWVAWLASRNREGYVLIPVEPTPKMIDSTWDYDKDIHKMSHNLRNEFIYKAMIGACDE